jgi:hypothetical protein
MSQSLLPADYAVEFDAWTRLMDSGNQAAADEFYFDRILPAILPVVRVRSGKIPKYDGLISLMGFTPETSVLAYHIVKPETFVMLHTPETAKLLDVVRLRTGISLEGFYHERFLHDDEHTDDIYVALRRAINRFGISSHVAVEMTGGKKTMGVQLANAVSALRYTDGREIDILYIDYDRYLPQYRKPAPESTRLLVLPHPPETTVGVFKDSAKRASNEQELMVAPIFTGRGFSVESDVVFVLMPFAAPWSERVWKHIQNVCKTVGLRAKRADDLYGSDVMEDVWQGICQARVVIADLTTRNPNVFYELGLAHTYGKRFVLLTQKQEDVPFDLKRFRYVLYEDNVEGFERLAETLEKMLRERAPL